MSIETNSETTYAGTVELSIVIVSWNTRDLLRNCLHSVYDSLVKDDFEVLVVENNSSDGTSEMIEKEFPQVHLIVNEENLGYAAAMNKGMYSARGEYILCLNPDTIVYAGTIERASRFLKENAGYAAVGCRISLPDGSYQTAAAKLFRPLDEFIIYGFFKYLHLAGLCREHAYERVQYPEEYLRLNGTVDYMIGAFIMIKRQLLDSVGGLDPSFFFCVDDLDWGLRINEAGLKMKHLMDCEILHFANQSGAKINRCSTAFQGSSHFWKKHYGFLGKWMFDYFRINALLREQTIKILEKFRLLKYRHIVFAVYMIVFIPIEILLMIPLEIKHRLRIRKFPSYKNLKKFEAAQHKGNECIDKE